MRRGSCHQPNRHQGVGVMLAFDKPDDATSSHCSIDLRPAVEAGIKSVEAGGTVGQLPGEPGTSPPPPELDRNRQAVGSFVDVLPDWCPFRPRSVVRLSTVGRGPERRPDRLIGTARETVKQDVTVVAESDTKGGVLVTVGRAVSRVGPAGPAHSGQAVEDHLERLVFAEFRATGAHGVPLWQTAGRLTVMAVAER